MHYDKETLTRQLNMGMAHLSKEEQLTLILFYYEDLNVAEICAVLEITPNVMGLYLASAKTKMRTYTDIFDQLDKRGAKGLQIMHI